jgi:hypothetical protein
VTAGFFVIMRCRQRICGGGGVLYHYAVETDLWQRPPDFGFWLYVACSVWVTPAVVLHSMGHAIAVAQRMSRLGLGYF